jgi:hypothetical protein
VPRTRTNKYLLSRNISDSEGVNNLTYDASLPDEDSFISLAATLMLTSGEYGWMKMIT